MSALSLVSGRKHNAGVSDIESEPPKEANGINCQQMNGHSFAEPTMNGHITAEAEESSLASSKLLDSDGDSDEGDSIDLARVHLIWSLSKDLGCSGLRIVSAHWVSPSPVLPQAKPVFRRCSFLTKNYSTGDACLPTQQCPLDRSTPALHPSSLLSQHAPRHSLTFVRKIPRDCQIDACAPRASIRCRRGAAEAMER